MRPYSVKCRQISNPAHCGIVVVLIFLVLSKSWPLSVATSKNRPFGHYIRPDTSAVRMQITVERGATRPYGGPSLSARSRPTNRFSLRRPENPSTCLHQQRHSIRHTRGMPTPGSRSMLLQRGLFKE